MFAEQPARYGFADDDDVTGFVAPVFDSPAPVGPRVSAAPAGLITWVSDPQTLAPAAKLVGGRAYSVVCDHLGTPVLMLDAGGQRVWAAEISTWGQVRVLLGDAADCTHRFGGQYEDAETGLVYNRYRYFDPEAGQYLCVDPIRLAGGLNSFAYVGDPLTELDPLGLAKVAGGNCGPHDVIPNFDNHEVGQGFSGIFDPNSGAVLMRPSTTEYRRPKEWVWRRGGHEQLRDELSDAGVDTRDVRAFTAIIEADGGLSMSYKSRGVNGASSAFAGDYLPHELQGDVVDAVARVTGRQVK